MFEQVAFQIGLFSCFTTLLFSFIIWILASFNHLRIESVGLLQAPFIYLYKVRINSIDLILGWLPLGTSVKIAGVIDEALDTDTSDNASQEIPIYEFRGRPFSTKFLVIMSSPILLIIIGYLLLLNTTTIPISEILVLYTKINFFQIPLEAGAPIWDDFYSSPIFLLGFIFLFSGSSNLITNLGSLLAEKNQTINWLTILLPFSMLLFCLGIFRLVWANLTLMNFFYFFLGGISMGIIGLFFAVLLAKVLPNY